MKKTNLINFISISCAGLIPFQSHAKKTQSPNVIIVYLDDMGYGDLGVTGAYGYSTPNIDKLGTEGVRFTNYYAPQAVSSASRAGLLTGCYPNRVGFSGALSPNSKVGLDPEETTIADVLKEKGYTCGIIGKWHVGDNKKFLPLNNGFDEFYGLPYSHDMWSKKDEAEPTLPLMIGNDVARKLTHADLSQLTTMYAQQAVRFIEKNKKKPFFLYYASSMPHVPLAVSDKFKGKSKQGLYGDVMMEIDWSVGEIMKSLKKNGLDENTLVIFSSDNGPWLNFGNHAGSAGGLREGKQTSFEGGQRVPCLMRWPGKIPAGFINNQLASSIDLLPTIAHIAGAPMPVKKIDGVDISPLMFGDINAEPRKTFYYYFKKNNLEAVRDAEFKLVLPHPGKTYEGFLPGKDGVGGKTNEHVDFGLALYDLRRDPGERYDVKDLYPEIMEKLMKIAQEARADLGDDLAGAEGSARRPIGVVE
jgi:Arylsulfatase A and related enzymes